MSTHALAAEDQVDDFDTERWVAEALERLRPVLREAAREYRHAGALPPDTSDVVDSVASLVLPVPEPNPMVELLAPFWPSATLQAELGVTRQALDSRLRKGTLLGLKTGSGRLVFPVFQFARSVDGSLVVRPGVSLMLKIAHASPEFSPWTFATLLRTDADELEGLTPYAWMRDGQRDQSRLARLASIWVREWAW